MIFLPADEVYCEDIVFRDPRNCFKGMKNYRTIFWSLQFHGRIFFSKLYVDVKRIWQPQEGVICMRWTVHGIPRVPWEAEGTFDGISTYRLDNSGKIYEHSVDNVSVHLKFLMHVPSAIGSVRPAAAKAGLRVCPRPRHKAVTWQGLVLCWCSRCMLWTFVAVGAATRAAHADQPAAARWPEPGADGAGPDARARPFPGARP